MLSDFEDEQTMAAKKATPRDSKRSNWDSSSARGNPHKL